MRYTKSPIDELKNDQSSIISSNPFKQSQLNYQSPKTDPSYILQSYRKLRIQQRQQLASLRMPAELKKKIFNFKDDDNLKHEKQELYIFNHPFRGKIVMTKEELLKQLQRQKINAQMGQDKSANTQKQFSNLLNKINEEQTQKRKHQQNAKQSVPKQINQIESHNISKQPKHRNQSKQKQVSPKARFQRQYRNYKFQKVNQNKAQNKINAKHQNRNQFQGNKKRQNLKRRSMEDVPIIGQEPKIIRDLSKKDTKEERSKQSKLYYRPFGNQTQIRQFSKNDGKKEQQEQKQLKKIDSQKGLLRNQQNLSSFDHNQNKQMSNISAIEENNKYTESNKSILNNALFLN